MLPYPQKAWMLYEVLRGMHGLNNKCWLRRAEPAAHLRKKDRGGRLPSVTPFIHLPRGNTGHFILLSGLRSRLGHTCRDRGTSDTHTVYVCVSETTSKYFQQLLKAIRPLLMLSIGLRVKEYHLQNIEHRVQAR